MTAAPPPSGYPPGFQPPPRKYRPSAGWFVGGIILIMIAGLVAVSMFVWLLAGFFDTDATLPSDGRPHQVSVGTDGERMLWLEDDDTTCQIIDLNSGEPIEISTVSGSFERSDTQGDFNGIYRFSPGSGKLEVTCVSPSFHHDEGAATVLIGPMPEIGNFVIGILVLIFVPGLLGLAGVAMLVTTGILWSLRDPKPKGA